MNKKEAARHFAGMAARPVKETALLLKRYLQGNMAVYDELAVDGLREAIRAEKQRVREEAEAIARKADKVARRESIKTEKDEYFKRTGNRTSYVQRKVEQVAALHAHAVQGRAWVEAQAAKAESFDRVVEMLDHTRVGNKLLGDCTKADLLRAAVELQEQAGEATLYAALYRDLAAIVGNTGTVREASDRGKIVALLTTTHKEPA